jgi:hypothetical protein
VAPEVIMGPELISFTGDVWNVGLILLQFLRRHYKPEEVFFGKKDN